MSDFFILESRELGVTKHSQIPTFLCLHSPRNPQLMYFNKYIISQIYGCYNPAGQTDIHGIKKALTKTMKNWMERKLVGLDSLSFSRSWLNNGNTVLPQREAEIWSAIMQVTRASPSQQKQGHSSFAGHRFDPILFLNMDWETSPKTAGGHHCASGMPGHRGQLKRFL